jgi:hypothetical protein
MAINRQIDPQITLTYFEEMTHFDQQDFAYLLDLLNTHGPLGNLRVEVAPKARTVEYIVPVSSREEVQT